MRGHVVGLGRRGDAVVETEHGKMFVASAVPGDVLELEVVRTRKRGKTRSVARVKRVLDPSEHRRDAVCPHVHQCGGCPWMVVDDAQQQREKVRRLTEVVQRLQPGAPDVEIFADAPLAYRTRARIAFDGSKRGFRSRASKKLVSIPECAVLSPAAQAGLTFVHGLPLVGRGEVRIGVRDDQPVLEIQAESQAAPLYAALSAGVRDGAIAGASLVVDGGAPAVEGQPRERRLGGDGRSLEFGGIGFAQAHETLNRVLAREVARVVEECNASDRLELFAGSGNFGVLIAPQKTASPSVKYAAVEQDRDACDALRSNLAARSLRGKVVCGRAEDWPKRPHELVLLDPPRVGAEQSVRRLVTHRAKHVVYVSCEPTTLERDVRVLIEDGNYRIVRAAAFDMFPQTPHLETLLVLERT